MASVPEASKRSRYSGSTQALATTLAPFMGPTSLTYRLMKPSSASGFTRPRSVSRASSASVRTATGG